MKFGYAKVCWGMMALTFTWLGILEVVSPPPYAFLIGGLLSRFSSYPLLMASSILVPQSHNSSKELIGQEPTIICRKQILDHHVDLIFLTWPINHPRCLSLPPCHIFEECFPYSLLSGLQVSQSHINHGIEDEFFGKFGFTSYTKHTVEATITNLLHSWKITCTM